MNPYLRRVHVLTGALVACALAALPCQAATLTSNVPPVGADPSFWDPNNWFPALSPGVGDTARFSNGSATLYLGDTAAFPAQSREISRLDFDSSDGFWRVNWGSNQAGGQSGGLSFSQDDPVAPFVGVQVGKKGGLTSATLVSFIDAENSAAQAMNISIGYPFPFPQGPGTTTLRLESSTPTKTLHADRVNLYGEHTSIQILERAELSATYLQAGGNDQQLQVVGGTLTAGGATLSANGVALLVAGGGAASIDYFEFGGQITGADTKVQIGTDAIALGSGGTGFFRTAIALAKNGGSARLVVDGAGGALTSVTMDDFTAFASRGGTVELLVKNGGHFSVNHAALINTDPLSPPPAIKSDVHILVDGAGSTFQGTVDMPSDPANGVLNPGAKIDFTNSAECLGCNLTISGTLGRLHFDSNSRATVGVSKNGFVIRSAFSVSSGASALFNGGAIVDRAELHVGDAGSATISDTAATDFYSIQVDAGGPTGAPANVTIMDANPAIPTTEVSAGTVNVGSKFTVFGDGSKFGGDQVASGPVPRAELSLKAGARLRIGDDPARPDLPLLAIGSFGNVALDADASAFIGDPLAAVNYQLGTITLAAGGNLYGNGLINGSGFAGGTHLIVLNDGGSLRPGFSPGTLTIDGEYVQQDGELELEVGGAGQGEYDVLNPTEGARFLGGSIRFVLLNGFVGTIGTRLDFFGGHGINFFDQSVSIFDDTGLGLDLNFSTGIATITQGVAPVPVPSSAPLLAVACTGVFAIGRRRKPGRALSAAVR